MATERQIKVTVLGEDRGGKKVLNDLGDEADRSDAKLGKFGDGVTKFGKVAAAGFAVVAVAGTAAAVSVLSAGSDLQETLSKSNAIFGDNAKAMEEWASSASTSFGQSKREALDAAASFGNMFLQVGIGGEQATKMSKGMTELASDFASFHNADITEVLSAQQAAFRGEYDAVQRFVPTINAAAVEQKALEMGLAGSTKELTAQHKALATERLLMEGAGKAMGDFDRTSDGLANRQRILKAKLEDVKGTIGSALIPAALGAMDAMTKFGGAAKEAFESSGILEKMKEAWPKIQATVTEVVQTIVGFVKDNWPKIRDTIKETLGTVLAIVSNVFSGVKNVVETANAVIAPIASKLFDGLVTAGPTVLSALSGISGAFRVLTEILDTPVFRVVAGVITALFIPALIRMAAQAAVSGASTVFWWVAMKVAAIQATAASVAQMVIQGAKWVWMGATALAAAAQVAAAWLISLGPVGLVVAAVIAAVALIVANWETVKRVVGNVVGAIGGFLGDLVSIVRGAVAFVVDMFLAMAEHILNAAASAFGWIPGIGPKLRDAQASFARFRDSVNASLQGIEDKVINVTWNREAASAGRGIKARFAHGDLVPGSGSGDTVPAMLTPGEFVVRKAAVDKVGLSTLRRINGMASGGLVGSSSGGGGSGGSGGMFIVQLVLDGKVLAEQIVDPMRDALVHKGRRTPLGIA